MTAIEYLDHLQPGWFALDVIRQKARQRNWVALLVDVHPDELKVCTCNFPALFYIRPKDYHPGDRVAHQCWFLIPGKYKDRDAAWGALEELMATRH